MGILGREWVTAMAMRLASVLGCDRLSALPVFVLSHRLKMVGIYTPPIAAKMVKVEAERNWSLVKLVAEPMRGDHSATVPRPQLAVTFAVYNCRPQPAAGTRANCVLALEPFSDWLVGAH